MTITQAQIESYRASWFPRGMSPEEASRRPALFARALKLGSRSLTASQHEERIELFRRVTEPFRRPERAEPFRQVIGIDPATIRARTNPYRAEISRAIDGVLSRRTERARAELRATLAAGDRARAARQGRPPTGR